MSPLQRLCRYVSLILILDSLKQKKKKQHTLSLSILLLFQQRFMIAAIMDMERQSETEVAKYLEACNLVFEKGLLSHCRVNNLQSPVLANIRNGMQYFEGWCSTHSQTGMMPIFLQATCKCNMDITSFLTWYCNLFCSTCPLHPQWL